MIQKDGDTETKTPVKLFLLPRSLAYTKNVNIDSSSKEIDFDQQFDLTEVLLLSKNEEVKQMNGFQLLNKAASGANQTVTFVAISREERDEWVSRIETVIHSLMLQTELLSQKSGLQGTQRGTFGIHSTVRGKKKMPVIDPTVEILNLEHKLNEERKARTTLQESHEGNQKHLLSTTEVC